MDCDTNVLKKKKEKTPHNMRLSSFKNYSLTMSLPTVLLLDKNAPFRDIQEGTAGLSY